jgi:DNA topoisomerase-3
MQVIDVCKKANPRLVIKRAKFSALVKRELERSVHNLGLPDENLSKAVDARQEIDLRIGASFTRFQTLLLQVSISYDCSLLYPSISTADGEHQQCISWPWHVVCN